MASRLLLVDNDRSFLKEHQVSLEAAFDIDVLGTPDSAVAKLEGGGYAAVLICVEVADNKGYALCSAVRKSAKLADLKVALISAKATEEEYKRHQSLKGRADLYLHKPITPTALVEALGTLVPPKAVDPDNPLGDLSDLGAGDDWLEGLKTDLNEDLAAPAPIRASPRWKSSWPKPRPRPRRRAARPPPWNPTSRRWRRPCRTATRPSRTGTRPCRSGMA